MEINCTISLWLTPVERHDVPSLESEEMEILELSSKWTMNC